MTNYLSKKKKAVYQPSINHVRLHVQPTLLNFSCNLHKIFFCEIKFQTRIIKFFFQRLLRQGLVHDSMQNDWCTVYKRHAKSAMKFQ